MDTNPTTNTNTREIVFCHACENEWYRDEDGLVCPECRSDFTEIVEANNDPRDDEQNIPSEPHPPGGFYAPDPDEQDIGGLQWEQTGPETYRIRGRYATEVPLGPGGQPQGQQQAGGLMGMVGGILQGMMGGQGDAPGDERQPGQQRSQPQSPSSRPPSAPGSPAPPGQQPRGGTTFTQDGRVHHHPHFHHHHGHVGPFSYTFASSSNTTGPGAMPGPGPDLFGNLFPRNAFAAQPQQRQPEPIEQMLNAMMMNIGVPPGAQGQNPGQAQPIPGGGPMGPFANLFQLFGAPPGGVHGDAVYSQEGLDRIISQLMEQHQAGNAPGPASAAAIANLPSRPLTQEDQGENGKADCSICMDEVELGTKVTVLPCGHWFHFDCVKAWLGEHDTCPHCRQGIMPKEGSGGGEEALNDMRNPPAPNMPGAFPGGQGEGTQGNPYVVSGSPGQARGAGGANAGMSSRMRDVFGSGSGSGGSGSGEQGSSG
ncbi:uncharacterized protein LTR77_000308 [Saxophila tyrrhenica]|uniref:RING-type E3 ubiquitin transferase n=1 Tax=Saxophila tyrrhenica TaxID=1690608 RepID=A0AAV9PN02_9PEZI|nr:hypothetical protein LTR77_000308 [Saxophila tyrrhenica]